MSAPTSRPKRVTLKDRRYVAFEPSLAKQVAELAKDERRTFTAQLELLIERGLRSYGLEVAAA